MEEKKMKEETKRSEIIEDEGMEIVLFPLEKNKQKKKKRGRQTMRENKEEEHRGKYKKNV